MTSSSTEQDKFLPTQRKWVSAKSRSTSTTNDDEFTDSFVVVTYNILADCHVGAETYPYLPPGYRTMEERHPRLLKELEHHGEADVLCLQEVNGKYFKEVLEPALSKLGYKGCHANKALGVDEGVATFYKPSRFELEGRKVVYFKDQMQEEINKMSFPSDQSEAILERTLKETVTMFLAFRCKRTGRVLKLGNVHAFWMNHIAMDVITLQIALAANVLAQLGDNENSALILCGDFNTEPHMPAYQLLREGRLCDQDVETLRKFPVVLKDRPVKSFTLVDAMAASFQHRIQHFHSAYKTIMEVEIPFSQFHDPPGTEWIEQHQKGNLQKETDDVTRGNPDDQSTRPRGKRIKALDYLWFSAETLECDGVLEMIPREIVEALYACPNTAFPSDHLLMKAEFHFK